MDQEVAYAGINRVLKRGGAFLNIFPSKWRPIEAHINIPFGGVFTSRPYLKFWALLGIRGLNQERCTVDEVLELGVEGAIVGKALWEGRIALEEALGLARA